LTKPSILHHKHSLEDGHVAAQIINIDGYRGIIMTNKRDEYRAHSPFKHMVSLHAMKRNPKLLNKMNVVGFHIHHGSLASKFEFLKTKYRIPMFVSFRGNDATAYPKKSIKNKKIIKALFKKGDLFFPVCGHLKRKIIQLGCPAHKIRVLYGGVNLSRFTYKARKLVAGEPVRFLAIGRFVEKKGFSFLIRAFSAVKKKHPNITLTLIGKGPLEKEYRSLIKALQLGSSVTLLSWVDYSQIQSQYLKSHIFCAPSCTDREGNQEGIPNTLKEAMATGMPVISTTHAGIPELVKHQVSGILVPEKSTRKLESAMRWLIEHPKEWARLGKNGRLKIERSFNLTVQLKKQKRYYEEVIKKSNK